MCRPFRFDFLKWFYPGMHIKRWLALMIIGVAIMTFGLAYILREAYVSGFTFPGFVYYLTAQFIPRYIRGVMLMVSAGGLLPLSPVAADRATPGALRRELGILPPGDVRNCIAALADAEPLVTSLFQYRFSDGSGLAGHSFGNLFIAAMSGVVGHFEAGTRQPSRA